MNISRRKFIGGAVGFAAFGFGRAFAVEPGSFSGGKPFFYFQHPHPGNTVYGTFAWGRDRGKTTEALSEFPNAVAFSGHSHYTLTDPHTIWQGAFTSVGTATLSHSGIPCYGMRVENHKSTLKSDKGSCVFPATDFPEGKPVEFAVRPLDAFLNAGRPILCTLKA